MASSVSSSLPSENEEVKNHLYQNLDRPGPRGAYEARQADGGFYVRVDMPGVPPELVKVVKRGEARTVTFTGKAPRRWDIDTGDRVYGGYVVVDRDPQEIDVEITVVNGCLRLFFPNTDGVLHSLSSRLKPPVEQLFCAFPDAAPLYNGEIPVLPTAESSHINPFLLDGVVGVYESRIVHDWRGHHSYLRVDMPGIGEKNFILEVDGTRLIHGGEGSKDHRLDEGGRSYYGGAEWMCKCCEMSKLGMNMMVDGVLRVLFNQKCVSKRKNNSGSGSLCYLSLFHSDKWMS